MNELLNSQVIEGAVAFVIAIYIGLIAAGAIHYELSERKKSVAVASKVTAPILLVFAVLSIFRGIVGSTVDPVESFAYKFAEEVNSMSLSMVDTNTKLLGATSTGKVVNIKYSVINHELAEIDPDALKSQTSTSLSDHYCSLKEFKKNFEHGLGLNVQYSDKNGESITQFWINTQACAKRSA